MQVVAAACKPIRRVSANLALAPYLS
jgi:hypothetical protein